MNKGEYMSTNLDTVKKIKDILVSKGQKLSVAESLTSGMLQATIAQVSGISDCFEGGITAYSLEAKVKHLKVDEKHAQSVNCVSHVVAMQMAHGVNKLFNTNLAISTTGYAEAYEPEGIKEPIAYVSISYCGLDSHHKVTLPKHLLEVNDMRQLMRDHVTSEALRFALDMIKTEILEKYTIHN